MPTPEELPTVTPGSDPRFVRVRRRDGAEFELPAETAAQLGLSAPPAAPVAPQPSALETFIAGLGQQPAAPTPPAAPVAPPPPAIPADVAGDVAGLLTEQGQRRLGVQPPAQPHTGPIPAAVDPARAREFDQAAQRAMGRVPEPAPRPGETFVSPVAPQQPAATPAAPPIPAGVRPRRQAGEPAAPPTEADQGAALVDALTARPQGDQPIAPVDMRASSPLEQEQQRIAEGQRLAGEQAHSEAVAAAEREDILVDAQRQQAELERERQAAMNAAQRQYLAAFEEARNTRIDPARFYRDRGAAGTIGVAIATALGGFGAALAGGENRALASIERAIDRDIAAQESNQRNAQAQVGNARTFLDMTRQQFSDAQAAQDAARSLAWNQVAERANAQAAQLREGQARLNAQQLAAEATARAQQAAQAAIVAQQDREIANARAMAETRRLNAQAARDERRAGGGGGGGAAGRGAGATPRELIGTAEDPLVQEAIALGISETVAREMASDARASRSSGRVRLQERVSREAASRGRSAAAASIPGWQRTEDAPLLNQTQLGAARQIAIADLEFQAAVRRIERLADRIGVGDRVLGRIGMGSQEYQEFQHALDVVRTQFRNINQMGNSLGAQEQLEHSFPDLNANTTINAILNNVRAAQQVKHDYVTSLLRANGYVPGGGGGHGGEEAPAEPLPSGVERR